VERMCSGRDETWWAPSLMSLTHDTRHLIEHGMLRVRSPGEYKCFPIKKQ
jgi:hypothetical protein